MKKGLLFSIILVVLVSAVSFYGGMKYSDSKNSKKGAFPNFGNLSAEERQNFQQMNGARRAGSGGQNGANFSGGEIIAKDDKSITVKAPDNNSKIIFFSAETKISKSASGTAEDLKVGENITANGTTNQDGSLTAESIQLRSEVLPK